MFLAVRHTGTYEDIMTAPTTPFIWRRTEIGGTVEPCDFVATINGKAIGRIMRIPFHPRQGCWRWGLTLMAPHVNYRDLPPLGGIAETKAEAVAGIRWAFDLICEEKRKADLQAGREPIIVMDYLCSYPCCTKPGMGEHGLCYEHDAARRRDLGMAVGTAQP